MCQLTFVNLHNGQLNNLASMILSTLNSQTHNDGFGLFKPNEKGGNLDKTEYAPYLYLGLGGMYRWSGKNPDPILSHVRKASTVNNVREVKAEFSHPFDGERFVFAHNGFLEPKNTKLFDEHKGKIDSQIFHELLENAAKGNPEKSVTELLPDVYKTHFDGKFAFLIFDKVEEKFFAARGDTALLHVAKIKIFKDYKETQLHSEGYIVNTEYQTFLNAIVLVKNLLEMQFGLYLHYEKGMIELLPANTIFELGTDEVKKIGEIKETKKYSAATEVYGTGYYRSQNYPFTTTTTHGDFITKRHTELAAEILTFIEKWEISLTYFDLIILATLGKPLLALEAKDFDKISVIIKTLDDTKLSREKLLQLWRSLFLSEKFFDVLEPHMKNNLVFPYMSVVGYEEFRGIADDEELTAIANMKEVHDDHFDL